MSRIRFPAALFAGALAAACGLNGPPLRAEEKALPSDLALVPRDGPGFVSVRVADLADSAAGKEFLQQFHKDKEAAGAPWAELRKALLVPLSDIERLTSVSDTSVTIVRTVKVYDRDKLLDGLDGDPRVKRYKGKTIYVVGDGDGGGGLMPVDDNVFVRGKVEQLTKLLDVPSPLEGKAALDEALELAAGKHLVVVGVNPLLVLFQMTTRTNGFNSVGSSVQVSPPAVEPVTVPPPVPLPPPPPPVEKKGPPPGGGGPADAEEAGRPDAQALLKELPPEALPFKPLLQARYVTLTLDLDEGLRLEARAAYADKDQAGDGETSVRTALYVLRELFPRAVEKMPLEAESRKQLEPLLRQIQEALKTAVVKSEGAAVTVSARAKIDPGSFAALALQMRGQAESIQSTNNLKQMALAMQNYQDAMQFMPSSAIYGRDGKPLLSWRVAILPYIEQGNLYNQFKMDEPWDGPNNKKLLARMPKLYAPVHGKTEQPYSTYYQVFVGPGAPFQIAPGAGGPFGARGPSIVSFTDGTSNTLLIVEAGEAVPWTKPDDISFDEKKPVPKLGGDFGTGFHAAMADGSVLFIKKEIDDKLLKLLIMPADGNPIDWDKVPVIGRNSFRSQAAPSGRPVTTPAVEPAGASISRPGDAIPPREKERPPAEKGPPPEGQ